jgi:hypothetical protein
MEIATCNVSRPRTIIEFWPVVTNDERLKVDGLSACHVQSSDFRLLTIITSHELTLIWRVKEAKVSEVVAMGRNVATDVCIYNKAEALPFD